LNIPSGSARLSLQDDWVRALALVEQMPWKTLEVDEALWIRGSGAVSAVSASECGGYAVSYNSL